MYRKRLLAFLSALFVGVSTSPAAAIGTAGTATDGGQLLTEDTPIVEAVEALVDAGEALLEDGPEVDEEVEGVGSLYVDLDENEGTLTVGVGVEPLGIEERITLPPSSGDEPTPDEGTDATPEQVEDADIKADLDEAKAEAAADAAATQRPAFSADLTERNASGEVDAAAGVTQSIRPQVSPAPGADTAANGGLDDGINNPFLRVMASILLAGTGTAWAFGKRYDLG